MVDPQATPATLAGSFGLLDWSIVFGTLAATTLIGVFFGKQATIRDFFLGGRKLPWWAVSASIVATEISALTLVDVPFLVYKPGGNFAYLQVVLIGSVIARCTIAWLLVPAYYEREIYSPYDYMGAKLGARVRAMASGLFALGGVLSQGARVYLTAVVLEVILHDELGSLAAATHVPSLALSVGIITLFAVLWTFVGGIVTVIWTDVLLFLVFTASAGVAVWTIAQRLDLGFERIWRVGIDSHRFQLFDFDTSPVKAYTFWAAAIAFAWGNVAAYGVDQLMAQRIFCCKGVKEARKALVSSSITVVVVALVALVGVGLFAYYERNPLSDAALKLYTEKGDRIFPIFITEVVPAGWKGFLVAGIFAAAISSLDAILAALSQTLLAIVYLPLRARSLAKLVASARPSAASEERRSIRASRVFVVLSGALLGAISVLMQPVSRHYGSILDLGLSMAGYTQGALLACFLLAFLDLGTDRDWGSGFLWSAPLSVAGVFATAWHGPRSESGCVIFAGLFLGAWIVARAWPDARAGFGKPRILAQTALLAVGLALLVWVNRYGLIAFEKDPSREAEWGWLPLAFPWYVPLGCTIAFVFGHVLARDRTIEDGRAPSATVPASS